MRYKIRPQSGRRSGIAAVETALILPVLILFMIGTMDLGRVSKVCDSVANAARNGAQYGSVNTTAAANSTAIRAAALTEMGNLPNVSSTNPTVTATTVTNSGQQFIQVTVTYSMTGFSFFNVFSVSNITRTVQMPMMPQAP